MMRRILFLFLFVLFSAILSCSKSSEHLENAKKAEASGNLKEAYLNYSAALLKVSPTEKIPDANRSKFLEPGLWKKEVESYLAWVTAGSKKVSPQVNAIIGGIERCVKSFSSDNYIFNLKSKELTEAEYLGLWNKTFFVSGASVNPEHAALASGNHQRNLSFITFSCFKNYTYEGSLLNVSNGSSTGFVLYPEGSVTFLASPGKHLLVYRSTVTFPSGEVWRSQYTTVEVAVPEKASLITAELKTSVSRSKQP
ncbi:MAG: hypothetical protein GX556_00125 [Fibrobacter sp.]|nr:hypothetical protein [Fibrobacter sp.]